MSQDSPGCDLLLRNDLVFPTCALCVAFLTLTIVVAQLADPFEKVKRKRDKKREVSLSFLYFFHMLFRGRFSCHLPTTGFAQYRHGRFVNCLTRKIPWLPIAGGRSEGPTRTSLTSIICWQGLPRRWYVRPAGIASSTRAARRYVLGKHRVTWTRHDSRNEGRLDREI